MEQLFSNYSFKQIFLFVIILTIAIKEFIVLLDWFNERINRKVDKDRKTTYIEKELHKQIEKKELQIVALQQSEKRIKESIQDLNKKINILIQSDQNDIRAWITAQHHKFMEKGSIDYYSFECISKRYEDYKEQGGNTFIDHFMEEIKSLPKTGSKAN